MASSEIAYTVVSHDPVSDLWVMLSKENVLFEVASHTAWQYEG